MSHLTASAFHDVPAPSTTPGAAGEARRARSGMWWVSFVAVVSVVGPCLRLLALSSTEAAVIVALVGLVLAVGLRTSIGWGWPEQLGAVLPAALVVLVTAGAQVSFWFAAGALVSSWAGRSPRSQRSVVLPPTGTVAALVILATAMGLRGRVHLGWAVPILFALLSSVVVLVSERWPHLPRALGNALGTLAARVLFTGLGIVAVVIPGALRRWSPAPEFAAAGHATGWHRLERKPTWPARTWLPTERAGGPRTWVRRLAPIVLLALIAVAIHRWRAADEGPSSVAARAAGTPATTSPPSTPGQPEPGNGAPADDEPAPATPSTTVPPAFADSPWYPTYASDLQYGQTWLPIFRQVGYTKLKDGGTRYMNIEDGVRRTWEPPTCRCPSLTLWFYGSATALGLGQRDQHTIPSQLAKKAWSRGIALHVVNKGVPGDQYWRQADRFAWDLSVEPAPDLVLFYTGVSDVNAALWLAENRLGDRDRPDDLVTLSFLNDPPVQELITSQLVGDASDPEDAPPGVAVIDPATETTLDPDGVGRLAAARLRRSLPMGPDLARHHGVVPLVFWEPMRLGRPAVAGEPVLPTDPDLRVTVAAATADLPDGVVDLTGAFDGATGPLYFDDVHHNEEGAELAAEAILLTLGPVLDMLTVAAGGPS